MIKSILDNGKYDELQVKLLEEVIVRIRDTLIDKGVNDEMIYDITGDIAFSVCAVLDASAIMHLDGEEVLPFLAFSRSRDEKDTLLVNNVGSYLHEMVFGVLDDVYFDDEDE